MVKPSPGPLAALHTASVAILAAVQDLCAAHPHLDTDALAAARFDLSRALTQLGTQPSLTRANGHVPTVGVDFDGVLVTYDHGYGDGSIYGTLMDGAKTGLALLMAHYAVFVHTSRDPDQVSAWLRDEGIPAKSPGELGSQAGEPVEHPPFWTRQDTILVTQIKVPAVAYLDDRAVPFVSWPHALVQLLGHLPGAVPEGSQRQHLRPPLVSAWTATLCPRIPLGRDHRLGAWHSRLEAENSAVAVLDDLGLLTGTWWPLAWWVSHGRYRRLLYACPPVPLLAWLSGHWLAVVAAEEVPATSVRTSIGKDCR